MTEIKNMLEEIQQKDEKEESKTVRFAEKYKIIIYALADLLAIVVLAIIVSDIMFNFVHSDFKPKTDALEDAFISSEKHVFDFNGYMKKNGFRLGNFTIIDESSIWTVKEYQKNHLLVTLRSSIRYKGDKAIIESEIRIEKADRQNVDSPIYRANYMGEYADLVYDDDVMFFFLRDGLEDLDKVIKNDKDNYGMHLCPFSGLGIEHTVENFVVSPHDD